MEKFSAEIFRLIWRHLRLVELLALRGVCRQFRAAIESFLERKRQICVLLLADDEDDEDCDRIIAADRIRRLWEYLPKMEDCFTIRCCDDNDRSLAAKVISTYCSNIRELTVCVGAIYLVPFLQKFFANLCSKSCVTALRLFESCSNRKFSIDLIELFGAIDQLRSLERLCISIDDDDDEDEDDIYLKSKTIGTIIRRVFSRIRVFKCDSIRIANVGVANLGERCDTLTFSLSNFDSIFDSLYDSLSTNTRLVCAVNLLQLSGGISEKFVRLVARNFRYVQKLVLRFPRVRGKSAHTPKNLLPEFATLERLRYFQIENLQLNKVVCTTSPTRSYERNHRFSALTTLVLIDVRHPECIANLIAAWFPTITSPTIIVTRNFIENDDFMHKYYAPKFDDTHRRTNQQLSPILLEDDDDDADDDDERFELMSIDY